MKIMKPCDTCQYPEKCELFGKCQQPPAKDQAPDPSDATACSGLAKSLTDLCEYLAEKSKEHQILAGLTGYSVTGDAMARHQKEWAETLDSWISQIKALAPNNSQNAGVLAHADEKLSDQ